ncbi:unnamed protein product [Cuscuta campestris]|nr:unnamed protein product [Cuscuta campestris]
MEGNSNARDGRGSTSSRSESSDSESIAKSHSSHRNFPSYRYFMSKPIHPLSLPPKTPKRGPVPASELGSPTPLGEKHRSSSASISVDLTEEDPDPPLEPERPVGSSLTVSDSPIKCSLCNRYLSQRSPWSARRIVRTSDMPVAGVLSCCHVFHAECLDQTTPKARKTDPPCPVCVDGSRNTILSLNRSRIRKSMSLKGNMGKEFPGRLGRISPFSSQSFVESMDHAAL